MICGLIFVTSLNGETFEDWVEQQRHIALRDLLSNISPPGAVPGVVIASPSRHHPDYFYDWTRDGGLTMIEIVALYGVENDSVTKQKYFALIMDYARANRQKQLTPNRSGGPSDTGNGEPKWNVDLSAFNDDWGRPQNDGPALRARTLLNFAFILLKEGKIEIVKQLYDGKIPTHSVIKADLEFISHRWRDPSFEMWEEVNGDHFSNRNQTRRALFMGAKLATLLNDSGAAEWYEKQAEELRAEILKHWRDHLAYFIQTSRFIGGHNYKHSNMDVAVLLSVLDLDDDPFLSIGDERMLATAEAIRARMKEIHPINKRNRNDQGEALSEAIGRYPEDTYDGYRSGSKGNPWFLITAAAAEYSYKVGSDLIEKQNFAVTRLSLPFVRGWLKLTNLELKEGEIIRPSDPRFKIILHALREAGDGFLRRFRYHSDGTGTTSEQMNKETGFMQGAPHLTWNCATILSAVSSRKNFIGLMEKY